MIGDFYDNKNFKRINKNIQDMVDEVYFDADVLYDFDYYERRAKKGAGWIKTKVWLKDVLPKGMSGKLYLN